MAKPKGMTNGEVEAAIQGFTADAVNFLDSQLSPERAEATRRYHGKPFGNEQKGRSQVVLTDSRDTILAYLPDLLTAFFGAEQAVEYRAHGAEDVPAAEQATDFVNTVVIQQDNNGFLEFLAWFKDALTRKLGTMKYWWEDRSNYKSYSADRLDVQQYDSLAGDEDVEIMEVSESVEQGVTYRNVKYKHWRYEGYARFLCTPPEEVLISRDARSREDAAYLGHRTEKTRAELIAMGVKASIIDDFGGPSTELRHSVEDIARRGGIVQDNQITDPALVRHLYIESYPYLDVDGDGEAELVKCCTIGPGCHLVQDPEPIDERPLAFLCPDPEPHVLIGMSLSDRLKDLDKTKTDVLRATLDSLASSIFPRRYYMEGEVNAQDLASTAVGADTRTYSPPANAVMIEKVPFEGAALVVLDKLDQVKRDRVGPLPATMDPKALQSSTEMGVGATVQAASKQLELVARIFAETGVKQLFKGLLKLLVEHQPRARMVRLRNQYVSIDPRAWDADMDVQVNVALGGGLVGEKLAVLEAIAQDQKAILMTLGPANPIVSLGQYRHTRAKQLELKGFKDVANFYKDLPIDWAPPPAPPQPDPNMIIAQAELMKADAKLKKDQADFQIAQIKAQQEMSDLRVSLATQAAALQLQREGMHLTDDRERDKVEAEIAIRIADINAKYGTQLTVAQIQASIQQQKIASEEKVAAMQPANGKPKKKRMAITRSDGRKMDVQVTEDE